MTTQQEWYQKVASIDQDRQLENYFHDIVAGLSFFDVKVFETQVGTATLGEWPMVAFKTPQDHTPLEKESEALMRRLADNDYRTTQEREQLRGKCDEIYWKVVEETKPARRQVLTLLEEFYQGRQINYGCELITSDYGFAYGMIRNANSQGYMALDDAQMLPYLEACRQEFLDFGTFLKQKVLSR